MISSLVSGIKKRYRKNVEKQTAHMDPVVRTHLVEVLEDTALEQEELLQLEQDLHQARVQLSALETKQQFIETRYFSYRQQLRDAPLATKQKNQPALDAVGNTHKQLLASIEMCKRRIHAMDKQRDLLQYKTEECQYFLEAADKIQNAASRQDEETGNNSIIAATAAATAANAMIAEPPPLSPTPDQNQGITTNSTATNDDEDDDESPVPQENVTEQQVLLVVDEEQGIKKEIMEDDEQVEDTESSEPDKKVLTELEPEPELAAEMTSNRKGDDDDANDKQDDKRGLTTGEKSSNWQELLYLEPSEGNRKQQE